MWQELARLARYVQRACARGENGRDGGPVPSARSHVNIKARGQNTGSVAAGHTDMAGMGRYRYLIRDSFAIVALAWPSITRIQNRREDLI